MNDYRDQNVVVTGGTGALGAAVCKLLLERGARVHIPAFSEESAKEFELTRDPRVVIRVGVDLSDEVQVENYYAHVPPLWASIHLAGGYLGGSLADTTPVMFRRLLAMNTISTFLCCREAVKRIREADSVGGRIVNVAAKPALSPSGEIAAYAASKAAVASLTQCLAEELKAERIWVNAVVPSTLDTVANRRAMPTADFTQWPSVDDAAQTIVFLASPQNAVTRGALVPVYGSS